MSYNFLVASWGGPGHLGPTLTAARQLRARGHDVRFIARADARTQVEAAGFRFATWQRTAHFSPIARTSDPIEYACDNLLFGPAAAQGADVSDEIRRATTDGVLVDTALFGAVLAAEAERVPCALLSPTVSLRPLPGQPPIGSGLPAPRTPEERAAVEAATSRFVAVLNEWLPMLNVARASLQLAPSSHVLELFDRPARFLIAMSAAFDFAPDFLPGNVRYIGPLLDSSDWSKPWISPWSHEPNRPRALISFSTTNQDQTDALQRTINAIGSVEMDAVVTLGPAVEETTLHAPDNVTLLPSAPHDAIMKEASLVVTHGGHGTVSRSLAHGLPLLVMPFGRDQGDIAARVEARGLGLILPPTAAEAEIAAAITRLIREPQFLIAARQFRDIMTAEVSGAPLVGELEAIVRAGANA
ncbi:nucleotide disphospho-sugar-binding domain-containing protein [Bradyrhizobium sp. Leo170]|uniref:glycosyltransferase n=1 Tax=Bradyrhizobium sp. Leo170 TaxID=1571199 RepID=UPI00102E7CA9|nr:nucleotide disphospho-sugar-binding domain-containing protein [Bradyrhizobium sp. Leo170]TAI65548.1 glycosyl transferase family 28 [Bradyrhizobium sp. Leo170]